MTFYYFFDMIFKIIPNGRKKCIQKKTDDFNYYSALNENRILDLSKYDSLKKRDAEWLIQIKNKTKYETIAINYGMTEDAVKNRIRFIYQVINVGDKIEFLNKYSDFRISFGDDFIEED